MQNFSLVVKATLPVKSGSPSVHSLTSSLRTELALLCHLCSLLELLYPLLPPLVNIITSDACMTINSL